MSKRFYENNDDEDLEVFNLDENDPNNLLSDFN